MKDPASSSAVAPSSVVIEATGLRKRYQQRTVLSIDELQIMEGEVLAILGPNGAGKSTLFRMLALLERPDEGRIFHFGKEVTTRDLAARRRTAAVFQRALLFQGTVRKNVNFGLTFRRVSRRRVQQKVDETLEMLGISALADADMRTLSGGELQRVALARALVLDPDILFLDEPTSSLDIHVRRRFREDLRRLIDSLTATVVLITHDHNEALGLAQRVAIIDNGSVVQIGTGEDVFRRPANGFVADFMGVETVWRGRVESCVEGLCTVRTRAGILIEAPGEASVGTEVTVAVRPEDVVLAPDTGGGREAGRVASSVRNHWPGLVDSVVSAVPLVRVVVRLDSDRAAAATLGGEGTIVALITRASMDDLGIAPGVPVVASVKTSALHLLAEASASQE